MTLIDTDVIASLIVRVQHIGSASRGFGGLSPHGMSLGPHRETDWTKIWDQLTPQFRACVIGLFHATEINLSLECLPSVEIDDEFDKSICIRDVEDGDLILIVSVVKIRKQYLQTASACF